MRITDALTGEHGALYAQFEHLEKVAPLTDSLTEIKAQAALLVAVLESHAKLEDDLLFDALEQRLSTSKPEAFAEMAAEHHRIRVALQALRNAGNLDQAKRLLLEAISLARQHFAKEESVYFPVAEAELGEEILDSLGRKWARARGARLR